MTAPEEGSPGRDSAIPRIAAAGLLWLATFAILYTIGDAFGAWPQPPSGAFRDLDLWVGMAAGVALLVLLLIPARAQNRERY